MKMCPACSKVIPESVIERLAPGGSLRCSCGNEFYLRDAINSLPRTASSEPRPSPDLPGAAARDEAIDRAEAHADADWKSIAIAAVRHLASTRDEFTTDDVWRIINPHAPTTHEPRAMGAIMRSAANSGIITRTDRTRNSDHDACHRRPKRVWKSAVR